MKILHINKYFYLRGGTENYLFRIMDLQKKYGHEVAVFSMIHPKNKESKWSKYFVENIEYSEDKNIFYKLKNGLKIIYSFEAKKKLTSLLQDFKPDICHLHIFHHQLILSILKVLDKFKVKYVMKLPDYKMVCPIYILYRKNHMCNKCRNQKFYFCLINKCHKNSYLNSFILMLESYLHHKFLKSYRNIGCFICPSKFILNNVRNMGLKGEFEYLPNFINLEDFCFHHESDGKTIAYWGRISVEKGLLTLFKAIKKLEVRLLLIGDGPQKNELKDFAYKENINVTFVDSLKSEFLFKKVQNIMFSVCPSECLENNPNAVLESFALGKPVIGANIGGIPELVIDHKTGLLFESGNSEDLRKKILFLLNNKNELKKMSENSRNLIEKKFEEKIHYEKLIEIYKKVT